MSENPIQSLTDVVYDEFVAPNPYEPFRWVPYREYNQVVDAHAESSFGPPPPTHPRPHPWVCLPPLAHSLPPYEPSAVRLTLLPAAFVVRVVPFPPTRYVRCIIVIGFLIIAYSLGGAQKPGDPHPLDVWALTMVVQDSGRTNVG